jgi:two-component system, NtrC family, response regulator AtoC
VSARDAQDILVVEDERSVREGLASALVQAGYVVRVTDGVESARRELEKRPPACVLLDIRLKDGDGLQLLEELRRSLPNVPVIMATAYGDSDRTIQAMKRGAFNYVTKPFDLDALLATVARAVRAPTVATSSPHAESESRLLGQSACMLEVWKAIGRASASDVPVLITGETGVGKELVARAIHDNSDRGTAPFVAVNLAALPPTLVESELFGHEKGSFTGAVSRREGRFAAASTGTLFLDEIGDLDVGLQTKLLRVLQDGVFERVGSQESCLSKARVIAATSRAVAPNARGSSLREDLFYRLSVVAIHVPPLRERPSDIPILVQTFLARMKGARRAVSEAAIQKLSSYRWPGNVRELFHVLERACVMSAADVLDAADVDIPADISAQHRRRAGASDDLNIHAATARLERDLIERAIVRAEGNRAEAARLLGIARPQLYARMKELGISPSDRPKK